MSKERFERCRLLFGGNYTKITNAKVLLVGVGGVGGFCLDSLYRTGVSDITIVDYDKFDETNQNRQIGSENINKSKVTTLAKLYTKIKFVEAKVTSSWVEEFDFSDYDLVIDAIDDIPAKVAIANKTSNKLISSMGGAKRVDPTQIQIGSIWETKVDPFARKIRAGLKKSGFVGDFDVVYTLEAPICDELGSFVGVTGSFGLALSSLAIKKIIKT